MKITLRCFATGATIAVIGSGTHVAYNLQIICSNIRPFLHRLRVAESFQFHGIDCAEFMPTRRSSTIVFKRDET